MVMGLRLNTMLHSTLRTYFKPNGSAKYGNLIGGHYNSDAAKPRRNCMLPLVVRTFLAALDDETLQCTSILQ